MSNIQADRHPTGAQSQMYNNIITPSYLTCDNDIKESFAASLPLLLPNNISQQTYL